MQTHLEGPKTTAAIETAGYYRALMRVLERMDQLIIATEAVVGGRDEERRLLNRAREEIRHIHGMQLTIVADRLSRME